LGVTEFAILAMSVHLGTMLRFFELGSSIGAEETATLLQALTFALIILTGMMAMGLYQRRFRYATAGMVMRTATAFLGGAVVLAIVYYAAPSISLGRGQFAISIGIALVAVTAVRIVFMKTLGQAGLKRRVLVLGAGERAAQIPRQLRRRVDQQGFTVVGYVHVRGEHDVVDEEEVIRPDVTLLALAKELEVDEIVVAVGERRRKGFPVHDLLDCKLSGIDVIDLQEFFERETGKIKLDLLNPSWLIFSDGFNHGEIQSAVKYLFDILVSLVLLAVAWPFMLLTAAAIFVESGFRGPILYRQIRVGQHWRLFHVYKFRSMRTDAEKDGAKWAVKNDDRVTRVGRFIRKVRLDELPQIFNVLKGDMSFVGPRPERPEFVTQLSEQIPYYAERHRVKPGVTGWAQVCYPYGASEKDSLEKLQYDLYYIKNYSLFLDLVIILQTAHEVMWGKGGR
jgi:sugar transferase (PEP-CTERM system associated)